MSTMTATVYGDTNPDNWGWDWKDQSAPISTSTDHPIIESCDEIESTLNYFQLMQVLQKQITDQNQTLRNEIIDTFVIKYIGRNSDFKSPYIEALWPDKDIIYTASDISTEIEKNYIFSSKLKRYVDYKINAPLPFAPRLFLKIAYLFPALLLVVSGYILSGLDLEGNYSDILTTLIMFFGLIAFSAVSIKIFTLARDYGKEIILARNKILNFRVSDESRIRNDE